MKRFQLIIGLVFSMLTVAQVASSQEVRQGRKYVRHGNSLFRSEKYEAANVEYRKALDADSTNTVARYNLSRSMFPQDWLNVKELSKDARDIMRNGFLRVAEEEPDPVRKSMSYYNAGVLFQRAGELQLAMEAYKEALRHNPADDEARYNLAICKHLLKNQPQSQQEQPDDQNSEQQQKDEQKQEQQKPQDKPKDDGSNEQEQPKQQQQQPPMSQENVEQLLNNVKREENQTQKRMQRIEHQRGNHKEKNW